METAIVVFIFCLIGCGIHSWRLGRRDGINGTVEYLIDKGILEVDDESYDIQITAVHDRKGGMIETKYVASIKDKVLQEYSVRCVFCCTRIFKGIRVQVTYIDQ